MQENEKSKVKKAVALTYDPKDQAPQIVASGKGGSIPKFV